MYPIFSIIFSLAKCHYLEQLIASPYFFSVLLQNTSLLTDALLLLMDQLYYLTNSIFFSMFQINLFHVFFFYCCAQACACCAPTVALPCWRSPPPLWGTCNLWIWPHPHLPGPPYLPTPRPLPPLVRLFFYWSAVFFCFKLYTLVLFIFN